MEAVQNNYLKIKQLENIVNEKIELEIYDIATRWGHYSNEELRKNTDYNPGLTILSGFFQGDNGQYLILTDRLNNDANDKISYYRVLYYVPKAIIKKIKIYYDSRDVEFTPAMNSPENIKIEEIKNA